MSHPCPDGESLFFFTEGLLEPDERQTVAAHLKTCAACQKRVRMESELSVSLRQLPLPEPAPTMASAVRTRILADRRRQRASYWWWAVAAAFLLASGLRWLLVADFSLQGAALAMIDLLVFLVRSPLAIVGWLSDPETWETGATVVTSIAGGTIMSSPVGISAVALAALAVATAANLIVFGVARRLVSH